jgi:nucleoid-associated protein YgaU
MAFPDLFKLEKLKIEAFSARTRSAADSLGTFEAMFNPTTVSQRYANRFATTRGIQGVRQVASFATVLPATLAVKLLLDGTGVDQIGLLTLFGKNKTVAERIDEFLGLCYQVNGDSHEPNFLILTWGRFSRQLQGDGFRGRLASVSISYTSFDRDGAPLRAELDLSLTADDDPDRQASALHLNSPDLTHARLVRAGDTLPLMTADVYGSSRLLVAVARANDLDHFRELAPGRELLFPKVED